MNDWVQSKVLGTVNKVAGITIRLLGKRGLCIQLVVVERKKGQLFIVDREQGIDSYEELKRKVPKACPIIVNIEGVGVLVKKVSFNKDGTPKGQIVNNPDEFNFHSYNNDGEGFISVIRKDLCDEIVEELLAQKLDVITVKADPFAINNILSLLQIQGDHILGNWSFTISNDIIGQVKAISNDQRENYKIGEDNIQSVYMLSYSDCIDFFTSNYDEEISNQTFLSEYTYKKLIQYVGWGVLGLLFFMLLGNFFMNDTYRKEYDLVNGEYVKNKSILQKLNQAEEDLKKKENLIVKGGLTGKTDFAWYADRSVSIMPSRLTLNRIDIYPLQKKMQAGKEVLINDKIIDIEGESKETNFINAWINSLKKESWVKEVEMTYYGRKEANEPAVFNLKVTLNVE